MTKSPSFWGGVAVCVLVVIIFGLLTSHPDHGHAEGHGDDHHQTTEHAEGHGH